MVLVAPGTLAQTFMSRPCRVELASNLSWLNDIPFLSCFVGIKINTMTTSSFISCPTNITRKITGDKFSRKNMKKQGQRHACSNAVWTERLPPQLKLSMFKDERSSKFQYHVPPHLILPLHRRSLAARLPLVSQVCIGSASSAPAQTACAFIQNSLGFLRRERHDPVHKCLVPPKEVLSEFAV